MFYYRNILIFVGDNKLKPMNIFTKLILTVSVLTSSYTFAQRDSISINKVSIPTNNTYTFDGDWKISSTSDSNFIITGNKITNKSKKTSNTLFLNLYFIPTNSNLNLNNLDNEIGKDVILGKLEGKGTSFNNIFISFNNSDVKNLKNDNYSPLIVLKDKESNKILNYKILDDKISLENNKILINRAENNIVAINGDASTVTTPSNNTVVGTNYSDPKLFDDYTTVESSMDLINTNKSLIFKGIWELSVDFENLLVTIKGDDNRIINTDFKPTNDLKLLVYFSKDVINDFKTINGYELVNLNLPKITGYSEIESPIFKTRLTKILPSGEYYPTLVIVEKKDNGEYAVKSTITLGDKYIWK